MKEKEIDGRGMREERKEMSEKRSKLVKGEDQTADGSTTQR